jgi:hypothetical protein
MWWFFYRETFEFNGKFAFYGSSVLSKVGKHCSFMGNYRSKLNGKWATWLPSDDGWRLMMLSNKLNPLDK